MTEVQVTKTALQMPAPNAMRRFRSEMDRLLDRFAADFRLPSWRGMFDIGPAIDRNNTFGFAAPAVDVSEDEGAYKITAELPGIEEKNIDVTIAGDMLTLKGEKQDTKEEKDKNYYLSERTYGSFQRCFALPDGVDRDKVAASLVKGVLTITLPKKAEAQKPAQKIEVKPAA